MTLYHYCSNEAFLSIVSNKEIWAPELSMSNDYQEGKLIINTVKTALEPYQKHGEAINYILNDLRNNIDEQRVLGFCMSESGDGDVLSQWRGYANDGQGISIGFNKDYLESLCSESSGLSLKKVLYNENEQTELINTHISKIIPHIESGLFEKDDSATVFNKNIYVTYPKIIKLWLATQPLIPAAMDAYTIKNNAFHEECEWRLIYSNFQALEEEHEIKFSYRASTNKITPYKKIPINHSECAPIIRVVIGPKKHNPNLDYPANS